MHEQNAKRKEEMGLDPIWDHALRQFDDRKFMNSYQCNATAGVQVRVVRREPMLIEITGFLDEGEADHLKIISLPGTVYCQLFVSMNCLFPFRNATVNGGR
jgi:hypothetical protein